MARRLDTAFLVLRDLPGSMVLASAFAGVALDTFVDRVVVHLLRQELQTENDNLDAVVALLSLASALQHRRNKHQAVVRCRQLELAVVVVGAVPAAVLVSVVETLVLVGHHQSSPAAVGLRAATAALFRPYPALEK